MSSNTNSSLSAAQSFRNAQGNLVIESDWDWRVLQVDSGSGRSKPTRSALSAATSKVGDAAATSSGVAHTAEQTAAANAESQTGPCSTEKADNQQK